MICNALLSYVHCDEPISFIACSFVGYTLIALPMDSLKESNAYFFSWQAAQGDLDGKK